MADTRRLEDHAITPDTLRSLRRFVDGIIAWGSREFVDAVEILATILTGLGEHTSAAEALGAADAERISSDSPNAAFTRWHGTNIDAIRSVIGDAAYDTHYALGLSEGVRILDRVSNTGLLPQSRSARTAS
jgi:hypothetical protein